MTRDRLLQLLRSIFESRDDEIPCSEFFDTLPQYVDQVVADGQPPSDRAGAAVTHHIAQCPECKEAYEALLVLARGAQ